MSAYVTISVSNAYGQKGAYVARIKGTHPKFGLDREFLAGLSPRITEPGIYEDCDVDRKGRKEKGFYVVTLTPAGELVKVRAGEETVFEIIKSGRPVTDLVLIADQENPQKWFIRRSDNQLNWRAEEDSSQKPTSLQDALARIEANAAYLTESEPGQAIEAEALREALAKIRDIARAALGMVSE